MFREALRILLERNPEFEVVAETGDGLKVRDLLQRARSTRLLVIDDAGTEHVGESGYSAARIADLLCERHAHRSKTILTTNLPRKPLAARYGERVNDRLNQGGVCVALGGKSLRTLAVV